MRTLLRLLLLLCCALCFLQVVTCWPCQGRGSVACWPCWQCCPLLPCWAPCLQLLPLLLPAASQPAGSQTSVQGMQHVSHRPMLFSASIKLTGAVTKHIVSMYVRASA